MSVKCKAAIAMGNGNFTIENIVVNEPRADEVLVAIKAAALCHTDYDSLNWGKPLILGHEGAGVVKEIGMDVKGLHVGDSVILNWATPCLIAFNVI